MRLHRIGRKRGVGVGVPGRKRLDRESDTHGIEWLNEVSLCTGPFREEDISASIEQEKDGNCGNTSTGLFEFEVVTDRDATHVLDLRVRDHEVRWVCLDYSTHLLTREKFDDLILTVVNDCEDLVEHGPGIGDDHNVRHAQRVVQGGKTDTIGGMGMAPRERRSMPRLIRSRS